MANERREIFIMKQTMGDKIFDVFNMLLMLLLLVILAWPLLFVVSASFSDPSAVWTGKMWLIPIGFNINCYKEILRYQDIWVGYGNTILYTVLGTVINLIMTVFAAYPLSRKDFMPRNFFMIMFIFTMYFSGGLIPTYLVVKGVGMLNTIWAMMIPGAVSIFNVVITRTYFQNNIPESLKEAAELDGANTAQFLIKIVLPLSTPILAVMALYYGVGHWNSYFDGLIYLQDTSKYPLQMFLRDILIQNKMDLNMSGLDPTQAAAKQQLTQTLKYGIIVVASIPVLCFYPFVQKYFVKGVMIGAIKG